MKSKLHKNVNGALRDYHYTVIRSDLDLIPDELFNMPLSKMLCKHVLNLDNKAMKLMQYSNELGYESRWGAVKGHACDLKFNKDIILEMERIDFCRPVRIVVCSYEFKKAESVWVDNLHTAIYYIRKFGKKNLKLRDVPFYVVDITDESIDKVYGDVIDDRESVLGALQCAYKRRRRSNLEKLIKLKYTVGDFLKSNPELLN